MKKQDKGGHDHDDTSNNVKLLVCHEQIDTQKNIRGIMYGV